jgi:hypothetical protein
MFKVILMTGPNSTLSFNARHACLKQLRVPGTRDSLPNIVADYNKRKTPTPKRETPSVILRTGRNKQENIQSL